MTPLPAAVLRDLAGMLGDAGALASSADTQRYERGYRYGHGRALAIARPGTTDEVAKVVRYCVAHDLGLVAQGANTGLVGASTPDGSGAQLLLSLDRLRGIESINPHNRTAQVLAGTRLSELNTAAQAHFAFLPDRSGHRSVSRRHGGDQYGRLAPAALRRRAKESARPRGGSGGP